MAKHTSTIALEREIVALLQENPMTIDGLQQKTGVQYYTVRRIVNDLSVRGVVRAVGSIDRHRLYGYNLDSAYEKDTIPRLVQLVTKQSTKAIFLIEATGQEDGMRAVRAAKNIVRHTVDLMAAAISAANGADVNFVLNTIRKDMQDDMLYLKNTQSLYEQILKEPRFWNPKFLADFVEDSDFNAHAVLLAQNHYEQKDKEE